MSSYDYDLDRINAERRRQGRRQISRQEANSLVHYSKPAPGFDCNAFLIATILSSEIHDAHAHHSGVDRSPEPSSMPDGGGSSGGGGSDSSSGGGSDSGGGDSGGGGGSTE